LLLKKQTLIPIYHSSLRASVVCYNWIRTVWSWKMDPGTPALRSNLHVHAAIVWCGLLMSCHVHRFIWFA